MVKRRSVLPYERIIEEKDLIYEIITEKDEKILNFNRLKIVINRKKFLESMEKKKRMFERKPMQQRDWIIFLNNCYMKQRKILLKDKKATFLLRSLITEGIPVELRPFAYVILSGAFLHFRTDNPEIETIDYHQLKLDATDEVKIQVEKDIIRVHLPYDFTILNKKEIYKKVQVVKTEEIDRRLKEQATNILRAYSVLDPEMGYVQGMASIAVAIVYNFFISRWVFERIDVKKEICFELGYSEEEAFLVFMGVMKNLNVRKYFVDKFKCMTQKIDSFSKILKLRHPKVLRKLTDNGVRLENLLTMC